jgi:hypothetical protein
VISKSAGLSQAVQLSLRWLAVPDAELPDLDPLVLELNELEQREAEVSALRRKLHDRLSSFPSEVTQAREREVSDERRALHRRIDELRAQLASQRHPDHH